MKMKDLLITAEIVFLEIAKDSFNFPIANSIRLSFWILDDSFSTFSEIQFQNNRIDIGKLEVVKIKLIERDFLINRIKTGTEFRMRPFPIEIALGKVIEVQSKEWKSTRNFRI